MSFLPHQNEIVVAGLAKMLESASSALEGFGSLCHNLSACCHNGVIRVTNARPKPEPKTKKITK